MLTQDQIARVERLRQDAVISREFHAADVVACWNDVNPESLRDSARAAAANALDADALSALLQERETLRAALRRLWVDPPCHPGGRQCRDRYGDREAWCMTCTGELDALLTPREDR